MSEATARQAQKLATYFGRRVSEVSAKVSLTSATQAGWTIEPPPEPQPRFTVDLLPSRHAGLRLRWGVYDGTKLLSGWPCQGDARHEANRLNTITGPDLVPVDQP